jgi:TolB-like protein/DNA-binding SARP family transcriptional activator/Tfp pilus assembly protein PilF
MALSPLGYGRRISGGRERNVVVNVNTAQIRQLRSAEGAAGMRIRLLGPVAIAIDGRPVVIASKKARALLGYLALRQGTQVSRGVVTGLLWGERSESQARASLRQTLSELRRALPGPARQSIIANKETISWVPGSAWIDAKVLESAAASEDNDALRDAAELIGGELMEGLSIDETGFEQWLTTERERFRLVACSIYARLMERTEQSGRMEEALSYGLKLLSLDPLQENVHRTLMRLYAALGRHDAALAQYERCRRELSNQLGAQPEPETDDLARSIRTYRRDRPAKPRASPPRSPESAYGSGPALPDRPSIAVLPFTPIGTDEDSGYFAEGIADDIITELSRNKDLFVVARHSSFHIASQESDPSAIGQALGVRHLLAGFVRRADERLRLSLHLIECKTGSEVWAERYDRRLADLFEVQLEVARIVTSTIAGRLTALAGEAVASKAPGNFAAYDHVLRAQQYLQRYTRPDYAHAREHLEAAIRVEPSYARPYGLMCMAGVYEWFWELSEDGLADVVRIGEKALALDDQDANAHLALAVAHLFSWHHDRALHHIERAIAFNPNDDLVVVEHGRILCAIGRPEEGLLRVREAMRLNPYHPNWYWNIEGLCLHHMGQYEEAIAAYDHIDVPQFWVEAYLAACHAMCGRDERAAYHRNKLLLMYPDFNLTVFRRGLVGQHEPQRFLETFRRAGLKD